MQINAECMGEGIINHNVVGSYLKVLLVLLFSFILGACSSSSTIPVEELGQAHRDAFSKNIPKTYRVVKGDTLFSISLRYDLDYRKLAYANNISPPYLIKPNDLIYLREVDLPPLTVRPAIATGPVKTPAVQPKAKMTGVVAKNGVKETKGTPSLTKVNEGQPQKVPVSSLASVGDEKHWIWPVEGTLLRRFSPENDLSKGIDIGGEEGFSVKAAKSGEVVYAGSGLKGYGNLIIIRHDDTYISAYAHNRAILVREGQRVNQGEMVGELGKTGTDIAKLHFEIRKNGRPVDPLKLLPTK